MRSLREKLHESTDFLTGVELVSIRGTMAAKSALKARRFAHELVECDRVDWISITDNAGGNPQLAPHSLGKPILYAGKEVVIHLTCKDLNRNGLESEAWALHSEGFQNILAMTGDYPVAGNDGLAKPVFDIDSVGLIAMLSKMNRGFDHTELVDPSHEPKYEKTAFNIGAVTTNFKRLEGELVPQYLKLRRKTQAGASFIINQIGYDSRKIHELRVYMDHHGMKRIPLIGNVYLLNPRVAKLFNSQRIPGVVVSDKLLQLCQKQADSPDKGKAFFLELAAKQVAIYRGLGYRGAYIGGAHDAETIRRALDIEKSFSDDDWKRFAREICFSQPGEYFHYQEDSSTGLADPEAPTAPTPKSSPSFHYSLSRWMHDHVFAPETTFARLGRKACANAKDPAQGPAPLRVLEHASKAMLYRCRDCGDCSLPDIAYLCPESQCAKNQRNGPCGGTRDGRCEVDGYGDCIWLRAHERLKAAGNVDSLLTHRAMVQNQGLRHTSAWANNWLKRDHHAKP
ncbi:methylenetetrahydrofolate reductase C-terminal domain-containing protein [Pelagicoccus sp. SDUM812003]|uniref:methylenetetrahydrofolate reductase C-terminal domain-containing protein n=1 Tax=Pelagicoccus sp. SDUM812003 TaxID=3041267 RepID=UPI00281030C2|nr:methylenetetrahydrofolate reductase C-terminal domain-containing protein [Pelagicoccus sp. SDUM812003]MDQ8201947.1 methylenetetrahydrofolate reductase C-terminal domain-containing protein [Pelagicoccus sp. SDUM812003]